MQHTSEEIAVMDRVALTTVWSDMFNTPAPAYLSKPFLRRFLAFEVQARRNGGLPKSFDAKLAQALSGRSAKAAPSLKPGARLLREWNGTTHVVDVLEGGFLWKGQRYQSLSAIARAITGARWSGPRFFGLAKVGTIK
ncbi:MAG: DUF2924 domain-containing protein [Paracoccaceae bacterium]